LPKENSANPLPLVFLLNQMLFIRQVEETIASMYSEQEMRCPIHLSIGQEAAAVGVCQALEPSDQIFSTHRCHAHYLAKGGDLNAMIAEIYGKSTGCIGGRGGSMHLTDLSKGIISSVPIVASSIPLAVGAALADKIDGRKRVSVAFFGDACVEEGIFHESANFASLNNLPILFVCENNFYSVYTPLNERQPKRPFNALADAHGIKSLHVDGNNVLQALEASKTAVEHCRSGNGPFFLVLDTYRWREHCGPNYDNDIGYRAESEFLKWKEQDPVGNFIDTLKASNQLTDQELLSITAKLQEQIDASFMFAKTSKLPTPDEVSQFVYAENK
jgi:TPP-dependent pyruvate/acetoin dehydrogenase alpha subunit